MPTHASSTAILAMLTFAALTHPSAAQTSSGPIITTSSSSSFNWSALEPDTALSSWDLYTTLGSLGPGVFDTSSRADLTLTTTQPVTGPIGNGTVANGTAAANATTTTAGGGGASTGSAASASAPPAVTGNEASKGGDMWVGGVCVLVGLGALMAAL